MSYDSAKRVISGTWGQVWLDNEYVAEVYKFQAKISYNKTEIARCGQMGNDQKVTGYKGTGSIGMRKINSRMGNLIGKRIRDGRDVRIRIRNVSFDDLTLADWEADTPGNIESPFTFTDYEYLDSIDE